MGKEKSKGWTWCLAITSLVSFLVGIALVAGGVALYVEFPSLLESQVEKKVTIVEGHATYEQLQQPSIDVFKDFYFFNLTNFQEFADERGGVEPEFDEVGPYSFTEIRTKELTETDDPSQLNYTQRKLFFYNEVTSGEGLSDSDIICTINIPLIGAINLTKDESLYRQVLKNAIDMSDAKVYVCEKATDLAWGYSDRFIEVLHTAGLLPVDEIGIQVNDSADDQKTSIINTGIPDIKQVGQFIQWNGRTELDIWQGEANKIRGTEGLFFRPNLKEEDNLTAFVDDVMRSFDILYEGKVNRLGLDAYRYGIDNTTFLGAFSEPKNADYFSWCPDGMFFLGPTQVVEVPVYGSKPHFLDADPLLLDSVIGLEPDREKHDTVIDVEPITGANINFQRRLQVVVQVNKTEQHGPDDTIEELDNVIGYNDSDVLYFPVVYIDEHATMDEEFKKYLDDKGLRLIRSLTSAVPAVVGILIFLGIVLILVGFLTFYIFLMRICRSSQDESIPLIKRDSEVKERL